MDDSLFPFISTEIEQYQTDNSIDTELSIPKEYGFDFTTNQILLNNGKPIIIKGAEAIKVWIYKILNTQRNRFSIYSEDFGNELESLIGQGLSHSSMQIEIQRLLEEALLINPYIKSIDNLNVEFLADVLKCGFTANTDYGTVEVSI
jgi:Mg2+/Co2+ transporter CorC